jgi:5-deoxy-glucuronate isomerase
MKDHNMADLLVRPHAPDAAGRILSITPENAGWRYVGFDVYRLAPGQKITGGDPAREFCLVIVSGHAAIGTGAQAFGAVGERSSPFDGPPASVYVPAGLAWSVEARSDTEIAVCSAPGKPGRHPARLIAPADVRVSVRGTATNERHIRDILPETAEADSLLVVEVVTPGGHWSSYPPHRHERDDPPSETLLEETYYHRLDPPHGFAFQRVYTDDRTLDETMAVEDRSAVKVPRGYHPVGAPHGYDLWYLNVMAGPRRQWRFHNDPAHEWILTKT